MLSVAVALIAAAQTIGYQYLNNELEETFASTNRSHNLVVAIFERNIFLQDYLSNRTDRSQEQLSIAHDSVTGALEQVQEEKSTVITETELQTLRKNHELISDDITTLFESTTLSDQDIAFISDRIVVTSQESVDVASAIVTASTVSKDAIQERMHRFVNGFSIAALLIPLLMLGVFFQIVRNIRKIQRGVASVQDGKYDMHVSIKSKDEMGDLADALNTMADTVSESQAKLEATVQKRTEQLKEANTKLNTKLESTERFNKILVDRELRMVELKKELEELKKR